MLFFFNKTTIIFKTFTLKKFIISKKKKFKRSTKRRFIKLKKQILTIIDNEIIKIFNNTQIMFNNIYTNDQHMFFKIIQIAKMKIIILTHKQYDI